jgi:hypothetical protein
MHRLARPTVIGALGATILGLALIPLADGRTASPRSASDRAAELAACVHKLRTKTPALSYEAGVVRCVRPTRVETRSDVRWSTCKRGGTPAPGERCETGTARIELRATDTDWEWRRGEKGFPRLAERWHLYGRGTARCARAIHGLPAGDPRAQTMAAGRIEHVDFLMLWPAASPPGTIALGVHPRFSNWLKTTAPRDALALDARACRTLLVLALPLPPHESVAVRRLIDPVGVTVTARERATRRVPKGLPPAWRPVGSPLVVQIDGRTTATFAIGADRGPE